MKLTTAIATALMITATAASAGTRIERTNVATVDGRSVDGFKLFGYGITPFVEAKFADLDFVADDVVVMPEWVSAESEDDVVEYLASIGITDYKIVRRCQGGEKYLSKHDLDNNGKLDDYLKTADRCKW